MLLFKHKYNGKKMFNSLHALHIKSLKLYKTYRANEITQQDYLKAIMPLDQAIEKLELQIFSSDLQGCLASERSSLKLSH